MADDAARPDRRAPSPLQAARIPHIPAERRPVVERIRTTLNTPGSRLLVVGNPGIGKTTLLDEALREGLSDSLTVLRVRASEAQADQPFHGLMDLLAETREEDLASLPALQREAVEIALARRTVNRDMPPMALSAAVATLIKALIQVKPVAIVIDDLPWVDAETAAIVQYVFSRPSVSHPELTVVATQRLDWPVWPGAERTYLPSLAASPLPVPIPIPIPRTGLNFSPREVVQVPGLSLESLEALIDQFLGRPLPRSLAMTIHDATGGNPLWALELASSLNLLELGASPKLHVPPSIAASLYEFIRSLPTASREVLAIVAAMGSASIDSVLKLTDNNGRAVMSTIELGAIKEANGQLFPASPLYVCATFDVLGNWERMNLHRRIVTVAKSPAEKAYHADRGAPLGPDGFVATALSEAAADTRARGGTLSALHQAERALIRTASDARERESRVVAVAELALAVGAFARAIEVLDEVDFVTLDLPLLDRALAILFDAAMAEHGERASLRELQRRSAELSRSPIRSAMISVHLAEVGSYGPGKRSRHADQALKELARHPELPISTHRAIASLILAKLDSGHGFDYDLLARQAILESGVSLVAPSESAQAQEGFYAFQAGDIDNSRIALTDLIQQTTDSGDSALRGLFRVYLAITEIQAGNPALAMAQLERFDADNPWPEAAMPSLIHARGLLAISRDDGQGLQSILEVPHGPGSETMSRLTRVSLRGIYAARKEQWSEAVPLLTEALALADSRGLYEPGRRMWIDFELVEALTAMQRLDEASDALKKIQEVADTTGHPLINGVAFRLRGNVLAAKGHLPQASLLFSDSIAALSDTEFRLEQARTLFAHGRVLRRQRVLPRATRALEQALEIAVASDDRPLQNRIRQTLKLAPVRGQEMLTASESRVGQAVADGSTNKEIAASQFISVRTVEAHLSNIYRKLGIRSRSQLAVLLRGSDANSHHTTQSP